MYDREKDQHQRRHDRQDRAGGVWTGFRAGPRQPRDSRTQAARLSEAQPAGAVAGAGRRRSGAVRDRGNPVASGRPHRSAGARRAI